MGRPKGVKNKKGHKAGGSKPKAKKLAPGQKTLAFGSSATATDEPVPIPPRATEKSEEDHLKEKQERQKVERIRLKKVLEHPSNRYGSAVVSGDCTDDSGIDDDDDDDDEDGGGYDGTDEESVKPRYKRSYKAPQGWSSVNISIP